MEGKNAIIQDFGIDNDKTYMKEKMKSPDKMYRKEKMQLFKNNLTIVSRYSMQIKVSL